MIRYISLLLLLLMFGAPASSARSVTPLNDGWSFRFAHEVSSQGRRVDLPHTWNAQDALGGNPAYYRGMGVYEKRITPRPEWRDKRVYLKFHGANETAAVFVNSRFAAEHKGGYTAFVVDITDMLDYGKENTLTVKVTNALDLGVMPLVGDFNMYGGLYRNVDVVTVDPLHISLTDYAAPGVYLTQRNVSHDKADIDAAVMVSNCSDMTMDATVRLTVLDGERVVESISKSIRVSADTTERVNIGFALDKPHLWDGVNDPFMYKVVVQIESGDGTVCDRVTQPLGIRFYSVDAEKGFMLNGRTMRLHGVCRHQDRAERGNALLPQHHDEDAAIIKEIGANAVRLAHYPQADEFYSLMDKYGMIVWAEIPFIGPGGYHDRGFNNIPSFKANGRQQLREIIRQNYNHPSICFWGLFNELKTTGDSPLDYVTELNELAHAEDPSRLTTAASFLSASDTLNSVTDIIAWNQYFGWYGGSPDDLGHWLDETHRAFPSYKIGLSEYGAGASIYHQQDSVKRVLHQDGGIRKITRHITTSATGRLLTSVLMCGALSFGICLTSERHIGQRATVRG